MLTQHCPNCWTKCSASDREKSYASVFMNPFLSRVGVDAEVGVVGEEKFEKNLKFFPLPLSLSLIVHVHLPSSLSLGVSAPPILTL